VEAQKETQGDEAEFSQSAQKAYPKADHEMGVPEFYESNSDNSN
jgi:hypothetical protein